MIKITEKAYAKINLFLNVISKRNDGYHDLRMIMQSISLHDTLTFEYTKSSYTQIELITNNTNIPTDEHNLVYKAINLLMTQYHLTGYIKVNLNKRIPSEAGLGGGSSDCACTLKILNRIFNLNLSTNELIKIGATLGADVPFCIVGNTALVEGIGEIITPLTPLKDYYFLLIKPTFGISTKDIFTSLEDQYITKDINKLLTHIKENNLEQASLYMENDLQKIVCSKYPIMIDIINTLDNNGSIKTMMSGSGSTIFGIFTDYPKAYKVKKKITKKYLYQTYITKPSKL